MTYIVRVAGIEVERTTNAVAATRAALLLSRCNGPNTVTVESHGVYGPYALPELVGKAFVNAYDWQRAAKDLMA